MLNDYDYNNLFKVWIKRYQCLQGDMTAGGQTDTFKYHITSTDNAKTISLAFDMGKMG